MSVICLCGTEYEIADDTELIECHVCGQRFDFNVPEPGYMRVTVPGGSFDAKSYEVAESPPGLSPNPLDVPATIESLRSAIYAIDALRGSFILGEPMTTSEFFEMMNRIYMAERSN